MKRTVKTGDSEGRMPLTGHLRELRRRVLVCVVLLVLVFMLCLSAAPPS